MFYRRYGSDFGMPMYMHPKMSLSTIFNVQRQNSFNLQHGIPAQHRSDVSRTKWQVRKVDPNEWRGRTMDSSYGYERCPDQPL